MMFGLDNINIYKYGDNGSSRNSSSSSSGLEEELLPGGTTVALHGLRSGIGILINRSRGVVFGRDLATGRYKVRVPPEGPAPMQREFLFRRANLFVVSDDSSAQEEMTRAAPQTRTGKGGAKEETGAEDE